MTYEVFFPREGRGVRVAAGTTLLEVEIAAGLRPDAPCGGKGTCGKCGVEFRAAGSDTWQKGLACQTRVTGNVEARLPDSGEVRVLTEGAGRERDAWDPMVKLVKLAVESCPVGESLSDWARLKAALSRATGRDDWRANPVLCRDLGGLLKRTGGAVWAAVCRDRVLELTAEEPQAYMAAFDLGTTSIAGYLIHVNAGKTAATAGAGNPQAKFGGDVISRAEYALAHGPGALAECAREALDQLLGRMCGEAGVERSRVLSLLVAGNTAMHHLFLGIAPESLVKAPYNPVIDEALDLSAGEYGLHAHPAARLLTLPVIGGFVGADTVACLIAGDWLNRDRLTLMIDIGTNGELVLGDRHRRLACSTAAGPAFEGAKITCGMRGQDGAIDHVWLEDGALRWSVIGGGAARGICGSGLVDLAAALIETGELDGYGALESGERFTLPGTEVFLTQRDVREIQLAKAAIAAGVLLLAKRLGVTLEDIREVDIAGAFGNYIDPDSACAIGLLPAALRDRIVPVGNAAGEGARRALCDGSAWAAGAALAKDTTFLELATLPEFQDVFVDQLNFYDEDEEE